MVVHRKYSMVSLKKQLIVNKVKTEQDKTIPGPKRDEVSWAFFYLVGVNVDMVR